MTALHNHLLRANPPTLYMHVAGQGNPADLARKVRAALEESRTPFDVKPPVEEATVNSGFNFDTAKVEAAIGFKGRTNRGNYGDAYFNSLFRVRAVLHRLSPSWEIDQK